MGAWGAGTFENDDAMDWVYELEEEGLKSVTAALKAVAGAKPKDDVEAPDASSALAAAEVVAAMNGKPAPSLPEEVEAWLKGNKSKPDAALLDLARKAVARAKSSELQELWAEGEEPEQWNAGVDDLAARLG